MVENCVGDSFCDCAVFCDIGGDVSGRGDKYILLATAVIAMVLNMMSMTRTVMTIPRPTATLMVMMAMAMIMQNGDDKLCENGKIAMAAAIDDERASADAVFFVFYIMHLEKFVKFRF